MARVAYGMAIANKNVTAEIVDWQEFKKFRRELRVWAVPKTFFNYQEPFVGVETETSILKRIMEGQ